MKKQPEVTERTQTNLIDAFWALYQECRFEEITVKQIVVVAGYSRSTFYEYFSNTRELLDYVETLLLEELRQGIEDGIQSPLSEKSVSMLADIYDAQKGYLAILLGEKGDPMFVSKFKRVMRPAILALFPLVLEREEAPFVVEFALSAIIGTLTLWVRDQRGLSSVEIVKLIRSMLANGALHQVARLASS